VLILGSVDHVIDEPLLDNSVQSTASVDKTVEIPHEYVGGHGNHSRHNRKGLQAVVGIDAPDAGANPHGHVKNADIRQKLDVLAEIGGRATFNHCAGVE
jgi:hypothetical protein